MRAAALIVAVSCAACAPMPPRSDASFGDSVRAMRALQAANPQASASRDPVAGIDGEAARSAIGRYQASFRQPPATFNVLGIGGVGATSAAP